MISGVSVAPKAARIAVVVVNYQSYDELGDCLAALSKAADETTVVVVDHDGDPAAADALHARYPFAQIHRVPANEGFAAGVNRGARASRSDYLLLLNPDCMIDAALPSTLAAWMDRHPDVGATGPLILNADGTRQASARRFPGLTTGFAGRSSWLTRMFPSNPLSRWNLPASSATEPLQVDWVSGACMMLRRSAFDAVSGMDEGFFLYWEDADLCRRLTDAGFSTFYYPQTGATHLVGRSSRHAADASLVAFHQSAFRLYWKHAGPLERLLAPLVFVGLQARLAMMRWITTH